MGVLVVVSSINLPTNCATACSPTSPCVRFPHRHSYAWGFSLASPLLCGGDASAAFTHHRFGLAETHAIEVALSDQLLKVSVNGHGEVTELGVEGGCGTSWDTEVFEVGSEVN